MVAKTKVQFLLLDFGDVLIHVDWQKTIQKLNISNELFETIRLSEQHDLYERDALSTQDFYRYINTVLPCRLSTDQLNEAWCAVLADEVAGLHQFVEQYKSRYQLYILSNTNRAHIEHAWRRYPFLQNIKKLITSYELQARKPEVKIYREALKIMGAKPAEVLFFDDRPENVQAARSLGINADVCYRSMQKIEEIIRQHEL